MTKAKRNTVVGFRTAWSMYNDNTWRKSNRFGAISIVVAGVLTIITVSPEVRKVIAAGGGADEIQKVALSEGMTTLRIGAAKLVLQGVTSIAEVERIATE